MSQIMAIDLYRQLPGIEPGDGVFGIAYSIITMSAVTKNFDIDSSSASAFFGSLYRSTRKAAGKLVEDGHATTFFIYDDTITLTGIGTNSWVFYGGKLGEAAWARATPNANTDVYYTKCGKADADRYAKVRRELQGQKTKYHETWPNLGGDTRYENCISSSHMMAHKMGFGSSISTKGVWIPSVSNWATWIARRGEAWQHKRFAGVNTHMP